MSGVKVVPILAGAAPTVGAGAAGVATGGVTATGVTGVAAATGAAAVGTSGGMAAVWGAFMTVAPAVMAVAAVGGR